MEYLQLLLALQFRGADRVMRLGCQRVGVRVQLTDCLVVEDRKNLVLLFLAQTQAILHAQQLAIGHQAGIGGDVLPLVALISGLLLRGEC